LLKRLASKFLHGATGRKVAIDVEEVIDSGMDIQKALWMGTLRGSLPVCQTARNVGQLERGHSLTPIHTASAGIHSGSGIERPRDDDLPTGKRPESAIGAGTDRPPNLTGGPCLWR
jgi:hypothetical protein